MALTLYSVVLTDWCLEYDSWWRDDSIRSCKSGGSFFDLSPSDILSGVRSLGSVLLFATLPQPAQLPFSLPHCWCLVTGVGWMFVLQGRLWKCTEAWTCVCLCPVASAQMHTIVRPPKGEYAPRCQPLTLMIMTHFLFSAQRSLFNCYAAHWGHLLEWGLSPWRCWEAFRICCGLGNRGHEWG